MSALNALSASHRQHLAIALVLLWLAAMLLAFWWYAARLIRPYDSSGQFDPASLQLPATATRGKGVVLVHFRSEQCPCNWSTEQHLSALLETYAGRVSFYQVSSANGAAAALDGLQTLAWPVALPAAPAVGIWDQQGRLAYFGPYSAGPWCSAQNSLVEPVLQSLLSGQSLSVRNLLVSSCACDWENPTLSH